MERSENQRRFQRSKVSERKLGKWLLEFDGPDPRWANISSSNARVGHITGLRFDCVSKTYAAERKNVRLPKTFLNWWHLILDVAETQGKEALLTIEPTNVIIAPRRTTPELHIITAKRHEALLRAERMVGEMSTESPSNNTPNLTSSTNTPGYSLPKMAEIDKGAFRAVPKPVKKVKAKR